MESIPHTATYTSHDMQNAIIELMSNLVTEHIVEEIGDAVYSIKVDGNRDPTGQENISIVLRFINANCEIKERLLTIATADRDVIGGARMDAMNGRLLLLKK